MHFIYGYFQNREMRNHVQCFGSINHNYMLVSAYVCMCVKSYENI